MTMTTVAGIIPFTDLDTYATPENRAELALLAAEPGPVGVPTDFAEPERAAAAQDIATAIANGLAMLTVRERVLLAAALLPEFEINHAPKV